MNSTSGPTDRPIMPARFNSTSAPTVAAGSSDTTRPLEAVMRLADKIGGQLGAQIRFAAKHGQLQTDLKCEDCRYGGHYDCAFRNPSYPRCCCPERLDLNP